jgi:N-acetylmuramoyl-L-alanine amidase
MSKTLKYLILHCTATPEGRAVTPGQVNIMHLGPKDNSNGTVTYKGKTYQNRKSLPKEFIDGRSIENLKGNGWSRGGYAGGILLDGTYHKHVDYNDNGIVEDWEVTFGVVGINAFARHYYYVGGCDAQMKAKDTRTFAQISTMVNLIKMRLQTNPDILIAGHNQFAAKACPSFDVPTFLREIGVPEKNIYIPGK